MEYNSVAEDTSYKRVVDGSIPSTPILTQDKLMESYGVHIPGVVGSSPTPAILLTCPSGKGDGLENRLSEMACGFKSYR